MQNTNMNTGSRAHDQALVTARIQAWAQAVREKNRAGIMAWHAPDMLMFDLPPPTQLKGIAPYARSWEPFFDGVEAEAVFDLHELAVTAGEDLAFATALIHCGASEPGRGTSGLRVRLTMGLRKLDGQWWVTHEHHSMPCN